MRNRVFLATSLIYILLSFAGATSVCARNVEKPLSLNAVETQLAKPEEPVMNSYFNDHFAMVSYPNFFSVRTVQGQNLLVSGESTDSRSVHSYQSTKHVADWFLLFQKILADSFQPKSPGAIFARVEIETTGIKKITFEPYRQCDAMLHKPPPIDHIINELVFKHSVSEVLKEVTRKTELVIPPGVERISMRLGFAGDPKGGSFGFESSAVGNVTAPSEKLEGKSTGSLSR